MGNTQENNNEVQGKFKMQICLNKFTFFPGETIHGEIKLSFEKEDSKYSPILSNPKFYYALIHRECWNVIEQVDVINKINPEFDDYKQNIIYSKNEFYNNLKNKDLTEGATISFQIQIPTNIKSSFEYSSNNKIYGYSRFFLDIEIPESFNKKEILIFILKPPKPLNSPLTLTRNITKKKLGFIGQGSSINFQGSYPKNYYGFDEKCPLNISLDIYGSKENIKSVSFTLKRKITFMKNKNKASHEYTEDLCQNFIKDLTQPKNIIFNLPLKEPDIMTTSKKSPFFDCNNISKDSLICLLPSYDGESIKCQYYILFKVFYDSLLITNPEFEMPIDLGHNESIFCQCFILDVNKILGKLNNTLIMWAFRENNNINNKKSDINIKNKMKDIFGENSQKSNNKKENIQKIFGNVQQKNDINKPNNINKKEETPSPMPKNNINLNNNNNQNLPQNKNLGNSNNSVDLPSEEEVNIAKDEMPAPGLGTNK